MLYCFREVKWQQGLHSRNLILGKCGRAALRSALYNSNQAVQDGLLFALQFWHWGPLFRPNGAGEGGEGRGSDTEGLILLFLRVGVVQFWLSVGGWWWCGAGVLIWWWVFWCGLGAGGAVGIIQNLFFVGCLLSVSIGHAGSYYLLIGCAVRAVAGRSHIIAFIYVGSSAQINRC